MQLPASSNQQQKQRLFLEARHKKVKYHSTSFHNYVEQIGGVRKSMKEEQSFEKYLENL